MSALDQRLTDLAEKTGRNFRQVNARISGELATAEKTNLAAAINEVAIAQASAKTFAVGPTPPSDPLLNDVWIDTNP